MKKAKRILSMLLVLSMALCTAASYPVAAATDKTTGAVAASGDSSDTSLSCLVGQRVVV